MWDIEFQSLDHLASNFGGVLFAGSGEWKECVFFFVYTGKVRSSKLSVWTVDVES